MSVATSTCAGPVVGACYDPVAGMPGGPTLTLPYGDASMFDNLVGTRLKVIPIDLKEARCLLLLVGRCRCPVLLLWKATAIYTWQ